MLSLPKGKPTSHEPVLCDVQDCVEPLHLLGHKPVEVQASTGEPQGPPIPVETLGQVECPTCWDYNVAPVHWTSVAGSACEQHGYSHDHWHSIHKLTQAVPKSDPEQGWILYPCHQSECHDCYEIASCDLCGNCDDCCGCDKCKGCQSACEDLCEVCDYCLGCCVCFTCYVGEHKFNQEDIAYCESCDGCANCCSCEDKCLTPGWITRGDKLPEGEGVQVTSQLQKDAMLVDPVQAMADFYLCDYVMAVIGQAFPGGTNLWNDAYRDAHLLRRDAQTLQAHIVNICDLLFQDYVYAAIGGELRHHPNVKNVVPLDRSATWDYWGWMGELAGREVLTQDCLDLFQDDGAWSPSYGGCQWATVAETLLSRLTGKLDAKTWVDRVFSLQHCSGSLLDKVAWKRAEGHYHDVGYCQSIGNAHMAEEINFYTLCDAASDDAKALLTRLYGGHKGRISVRDAINIDMAIRQYGDMLVTE